MGELGSKITLSLTDLPADDIPKELYDNFLMLHQALKHLQMAISKYAGVDPPEAFELPTIAYSDTILMSNHTRMFPRAAVSIAAGQAVNLYWTGAAINARLANASSATTMAHGIAMEAADPGDQFQMFWLRGLVNTVGGLTPGTLYWLAPTAGLIQNAAPTVAGQIQQPIGLAVAPTTLIMDIPLSYRQL